MRPPRIVNRGRIAPSSPIPIIDSGRTSFSSASAVSTIDDLEPGPETNTAEAAAKQLESMQASSTKKKAGLIGLGVLCALLIFFGLVFGIAYPLTGGKSTTTTTTIETMVTNGTQPKIR